MSRDKKRSSLSFRSRGSFDVGSSKPDQCSPVLEEQRPPELTTREKELLIETWKELEENIAKVGVITFVSLFETHPDVQESFMSFSGVDIEDLKHSKQLRAHALRVMAFVQKAVARLHEPEKLETLLKELGRKHVGYGAKQKYVELVGPQFILAIKPSLEKQWDEELDDAWTHLFKIIEFVMVSSMDDDRKDQRTLERYIIYI
ncbi:Globin D, coelomic, putative [Pediculus humanus corporis]|uniref:Globin D, coelomic, putative n=1 Tax=Pediculus humanus subsp. corporis TaxID=121224 RepID=E0VN13_PEDHC|nr:Globin D, coelomic, putative [Pediculus humanus corporis]EEB14769.1 Globin D, coelomic, putative [Pediculus humanus corporis]